MWKPDKSLDEYIVKPTPEGVSETPRAVSLTATGEVEVLKPLIPLEVKPKRARNAFMAFRSSDRHQPLWFRRFVAVGSGALVMIAFVLVSAILVGISDPTAGPDVAISLISNDEPTQSEEPFSFDVYSPSTFAPPTVEAEVVRSHPRRRPIRRVVQLGVFKPRRQLQPLPSPEPEQPKFYPTTLVIYAENGVINTRIEPWLQTSNNC